MSFHRLCLTAFDLTDTFSPEKAKCMVLCIKNIFDPRFTLADVQRDETYKLLNADLVEKAKDVLDHTEPVKLCLDIVKLYAEMSSINVYIPELLPSDTNRGDEEGLDLLEMAIGEVMMKTIDLDNGIIGVYVGRCLRHCSKTMGTPMVDAPEKPNVSAEDYKHFMAQIAQRVGEDTFRVVECATQRCLQLKKRMKLEDEYHKIRERIILT